jgi:hypothetical protein
VKRFIILLLSCVPLFATETFVSLKSGETNGVSYGLSYLVSDSWSATHSPPSEDYTDLFLTLRNDGEKSMSFGDITARDFSLRDATGNEMKIYLRTLPQDVKDIAYGEVTVIHLMVQYSGKTPQPWMLQFTNPDKVHQPLGLTITGIELRKRYSVITTLFLLPAAPLWPRLICGLPINCSMPGRGFLRIRLP